MIMISYSSTAVFSRAHPFGLRLSIVIRLCVSNFERPLLCTTGAMYVEVTRLLPGDFFSLSYLTRNNYDMYTV